jgi:hypothetical protein
MSDPTTDQPDQTDELTETEEPEGEQALPSGGNPPDGGDGGERLLP